MFKALRSDLCHGKITVDTWLKSLSQQRHYKDAALIRHAAVLSQLAGDDEVTDGGDSCYHQGMCMAEILADLGMDSETLAAAIVYPHTQYAGLSHEDISEHLGQTVAKLVDGVEKMDAMRTLSGSLNRPTSHRSQMDNMRKMLLAMVDDVRIVVIKLAERLAMLRTLSSEMATSQRQLDVAQESLEIYAPLANRLGIAELKWEIEDLAFKSLNTSVYDTISTHLAEDRAARDAYIEQVIDTLKHALAQAEIKDAEVTGRAKHIYSIHKKMQRKNVSFDQIFDVRAVRILVDSIESCYAALGVVHSLWTHIPHEFDDYITAPKPNGYRSLHTAVVGPQDKHLEIQIRTHNMHQESELGVAAHWMYKEGGRYKSGLEDKISWLRQVLAWQNELVAGDAHHTPVDVDIFEDRVYVFTPQGDILDLPKGATPLDFAYQLHSEVGHRCKGAKVNGHIVPLTYEIKTGEQIEVLTSKHGQPSRDWLDANLGYLKTSKAKAKVHHWFKKQDYDKHVTEGQALLDKAMKKEDVTLSSAELNTLAEQYNFKSYKDLMAAIGTGDIKINQLINRSKQHHITEPQELETFEPALKILTKPTGQSGDVTIQGMKNTVTHLARCCTPLPGDDIVGYVTKGQGISIHRSDCRNLADTPSMEMDRIISAQWSGTSNQYPVDLHVQARDRTGLVKDITTVLANEKVNLCALTTSTSRLENSAYVVLTIEIENLSHLQKIMDRIRQLESVTAVTRISQ